MGSKNITKEIKPRLLSEVTEEARKKFPGLNKRSSIYQYHNLVKEIFRIKRDDKSGVDVLLSDLIVSGIDYYWKEGRN